MSRGGFDTLDGQPTLGGRPEGQVLSGRYKIVREIGAGGMGAVYLAEDMELDNMPVAVKVLPAILAGSKRAIDNLRREAKTALKLSHPNIVRLHTFQSDEAIKYLVMEYIDGGSLEDRLAEQGTLSVEETLKTFADVAAGLDHAHSQGILHRDIKPANIMLTKAGTAKLADFGIARELKDSMTRVTGKETSGTLLYMPPEQLRGGEPDHRSDIYSLAASIYECLCGHPPFYRGSIEYQINNAPSAPLKQLGGVQNGALSKGLSKNPLDRQSTAEELLSDLVGKTKVVAPVRRGSRRSLVIAGLCVFGLVLIFALAALIRTLQGHGQTPPAPQAKPQGAAAMPGDQRLKDTPVVARPAQESALAAVVPVKTGAETAWDEVKSVDRSDGLGPLLDDAKTTLTNAQTFYNEREYEQAKSYYGIVISKCDNIHTLDQQRKTLAEQNRRDQFDRLLVSVRAWNGRDDVRNTLKALDEALSLYPDDTDALGLKRLHQDCVRRAILSWIRSEAYYPLSRGEPERVFVERDAMVVDGHRYNYSEVEDVTSVLYIDPQRPERKLPRIQVGLSDGRTLQLPIRGSEITMAMLRCLAHSRTGIDVRDAVNNGARYFISRRQAIAQLKDVMTRAKAIRTGRWHNLVITDEGLSYECGGKKESVVFSQILDVMYGFGSSGDKLPGCCLVGTKKHESGAIGIALEFDDPNDVAIARTAFEYLRDDR